MRNVSHEYRGSPDAISLVFNMGFYLTCISGVDILVPLTADVIHIETIITIVKQSITLKMTPGKTFGNVFY